MIRIGIVSERPRKKERLFFERYQRAVIINDKNPFELVAVRIPYSSEQLEGISEQRLCKSVSKARNLLKNLGAEKILVSDGLKEYFDSEQLSVKKSQRDEMFLLTVPRCIRQFSQKCGLMLPVHKICIRANKMDRITEYLLRELCFDARALILCTDDPKSALAICERLFDDFGLAVQVVESFAEADADILIDTAAPSVRIGRDLIVDGAELDFELDGICVDFLEVAVCLKGFDPSMRVKAFLSNKKKLTLQ